MNELSRKLPAKFTINYVIIPLMAVVCFFPFVTSMMALMLGILLGLIIKNPYQNFMKKMIHSCLGISIVGLGFGMDLSVVAKVGLQGIGYTIIGILSTYLIGMFLGRIFSVDKDISLLISTGTAICGGSAIAAVAPVIGAKERDMSVALVTVFLLNAIALMIFPFIGHQLHLSETQFGLFSALAIHDTSSVVGASLEYGPKALEVGTTIKLARALWIIPVATVIGLMRANRDEERKKIKRPWFIAGFIVAAAMVTFFPELASIGGTLEGIGRRLMVVTLFLIGASLNRESLKGVGIKPLFQAVALWIIVSSLTILGILEKWIV